MHKIAVGQKFIQAGQHRRGSSRLVIDVDVIVRERESFNGRLSRP